MFAHAVIQIYTKSLFSCASTSAAAAVTGCLLVIYAMPQAVDDSDIYACMTQKLSTLKHQMRMLDGRIWDFSPEKPYHDISDFWDGEVPESNLE